jgi:thiol:disulfide interchange protein DsbD
MRRLSYSFITFLVLGCSLVTQALPDFSALKDEPSERFLSVGQAFVPVVEKTADGWTVNFTIADHYYLYRDRIHLKNSDDTLSFRQTAEHKLDKNFGDVLIFHDELDIDVAATDNEPRFLSYQGCSEDGLCYPPQTLFLGVSSASAPLNSLITTSDNDQGDVENASASSDLLDDSVLSDKSLFWVVLSFLGLGIGLSLTPCVFPMIPILSSIIVGQGKDISSARGGSLALSYVVGMASSYALIGILVSAFGASFNLSSITQMPAVILASALLFIVLALPMFGVFELQLPAFLRDRLNAAQSKQRGGAIVSTFLMGFFAALVVSPCVSAPLAGALVYLSSTGDVLTGGTALFALGMGMGGPLILVGLSGGKLLPRAGQWMILIKSAFGIGLLVVAIGLLDRIVAGQVTLLLSGALALGIAVFLGVFDGPQASASTSTRLGRVIALLALLTGASWWVGAAMGNDSLLSPLEMSVAGGRADHSFVADVTVVSRRSELFAAITASDTPVVMDVYADWCTSCQDMDELLHSAPVSLALSGYRLIKFDITEGSQDQQAMLGEWQVFGPPALVRFDRDGHLLGKALQGLPSERELIKWLQTAH